MANLRNIFQFGWPYLKRYRTRLAAGILLGVLFGISNASFLWATKTLFTRLTPRGTARRRLRFRPDLCLRRRSRNKTVAKYRPKAHWMPGCRCKGRTLDARQIAGGLFCCRCWCSFAGRSVISSAYCMSWVSERVDQGPAPGPVGQTQFALLDFFNRSTIGDLLGRVNGDTMALYRCMALGFSDLITEPITVLSIGRGAAVGLTGS